MVSLLVNFSHSDMYELLYHSGFDLDFPYDKQCSAFFFFICVGHLYLFPWEIYFNVFFPFLQWIFLFFGGVDFNKFFIGFGK